MRFPSAWRRFVRVFITLTSAAACPGLMAATAELEPGGTNALTLRAFLQAVIERNESLQTRVLEFEISRKRFRAEQGAFEPELVLSYDRVENKRENTAEQRRSSGVLLFEEHNNIYSAGLEALVPTGARIRLGYSLRDLDKRFYRDVRILRLYEGTTQIQQMVIGRELQRMAKAGEI